MTAATPLPILYAEDDPDDCLLAELAHRDSGVANPLIFVSDGEETVRYLRREGRYANHAGWLLPGIVILDLNMPRMDGRETLQVIKADPALRRIPVVILTTSTALIDIEASYDAGANTYIVKPSAFSSLVQLFERLCGYWFEIGSIAKEVRT
jgi:two-component system response regulator